MASLTQHSGDNGPQPHLVLSESSCNLCLLTYFPDGRRLVTGSDDGTVRVWNLELGAQEGSSMAHETEIYSLAVTRDGTKIISSDKDGGIRVWDAESHSLVRERIHSAEAPKLSISPDDRFIAVADGTATIYTMEALEVYDAIETNNDAVGSLCFSPDGRKPCI